VVSLVFLGTFRDLGIVIICGIIMILKRLITQIRHHALGDSQSG
jgi:hypothetical protein